MLYGAGQDYNPLVAIRPVEFPPSTNIADIIYDDETRTMTILFQKGAVYEYQEVDEITVNGFRTAVSATDYLKAFVANSYPSRRVR